MTHAPLLHLTRTDTGERVGVDARAVVGVRASAYRGREVLTGFALAVQIRGGRVLFPVTPVDAAGVECRPVSREEAVERFVAYRRERLGGGWGARECVVGWVG